MEDEVEATQEDPSHYPHEPLSSQPQTQEEATQPDEQPESTQPPGHGNRPRTLRRHGLQDHT